jgi:hypothetical protein
MMPTRGEDNPLYDAWEIWITGSRGGSDDWDLKSFYLSRILSSAKTSLNLLKGMYSHCVTHLKLALPC